MTGRLALLTLAGVLCACDAPPQASAPVPPPPPQEPSVVLSAQQVRERSAQCERKARETFKRDAIGGTSADYAHHYSRKLDTCFYLLTVAHQETLSKKLLDITENETYGEFLGLPNSGYPPAPMPAACRVESLYCASMREWEVLVGPYMHD
jgi:hypothetical protein